MRWYELYGLYGECMKECKVKVLGYTGGGEDEEERRDDERGGDLVSGGQTGCFIGPNSGRR
jgi:hypothetical protein